MKRSIELLLSFSSFIIHHYFLHTPWPPEASNRGPIEFDIYYDFVYSILHERINKNRDSKDIGTE